MVPWCVWYRLLSSCKQAYPTPPPSIFRSFASIFPHCPWKQNCLRVTNEKIFSPVTTYSGKIYFEKRREMGVVSGPAVTTFEYLWQMPFAWLDPSRLTDSHDLRTCSLSLFKRRREQCQGFSHIWPCVQWLPTVRLLDVRLHPDKGV